MEEAALPGEIGGYRIVEPIGEGSMGRVFRARQSHPAREVALKLVLGLGREAGARLRREMAILARLEHPGIARLYAAGEDQVAGLSVPWLALEYVRGVDLRTWSRQQSPSLAQRVGMLVAIARAVHYAHGRGVVHRDLKPANILVDGAGLPRVLDFGIARLLDDGGDTTRAGQVLGSLPYMSPEQLGGDSALVDARSDVHALGALGYELLCGRLPHPRLAEATLFEAIEIHRTETPAPPSQHAPGLPRDLDLVVMKALAPEPARRYSSAAELAADLERWLQHRPVEARPATLGYVLGRFARRHRALAAAVLLVATTLIVASAVSLHYAWRATQARDLAEQRAAESEAVTAFLERMLAAADPAQAQGSAPTVTEVLDAAERELALGADLSSPVRIQAQRTLASTRQALGDYERALALIDAASSQAASGADDPRLQHGLLRMRASVLTELGRFDEAAAALDQAEGIWPQAPTGERVRVLLTRSRLHDEAGRQAEAIAGYQGVVDAADVIGVDPAVIETARSNLIGALRDAGRNDEALVLANRVLSDRRARDGERHPRTLSSRHARMTVLQGLGRLDEAASEGLAVLALRREVLGEDHVLTLTTAQMLANVWLEQGRNDEAEPLIRDTAAAFEARFGPAHGQTVTSLNALAYLLEAQGRVEESEAVYRRILAIQLDQDQRHPAALVTRNNLGMLLLDANRLDAAEHELRELLAQTEAQLGREHVYHAMFASNLGLCLSRRGQSAEAIELLEVAQARLADVLGEDHARTLAAGERLQQARAQLRANGAAGGAP